ncbi:MAG: trypsin-like peptidase domain-containing protein, partial [Campylobacterales bacterium]
MKKMLCAALIACAATLSADAGRIDQLSSVVPGSYAPMIDTAAKSVVYLMTPKDELAGVASPFVEDPWFRPYLQFPQLGLSSQKLRRSIGSGVVLTQDGLIVTSAQFVENRKSVKVVVPGHPEPYDARVLGSDLSADLAVLKIIAENLPKPDFANRSNLQAGELLFAIGNPFGLEPVVSMGIVSTTGYRDQERLLQSDLFIHGGNIGGAIINARGELAGIPVRLRGMSRRDTQGGFFLPIDRVQEIANRIQRSGSVKEAWLGIAVADLSQEMKSYFGREEGVLVTAVEPHSPADRAGIRKGDLIILADDIIVNSVISFERILSTLIADRDVVLLYLREKRIQEAAMRVGRLEGEATRSARSLYHHGLILETLTPVWQERLKLDEITLGVVITDVEQSSPAIKSG